MLCGAGVQRCGGRGRDRRPRCWAARWHCRGRLPHRQPPRADPSTLLVDGPARQRQRRGGGGIGSLPEVPAAVHSPSVSATLTRCCSATNASAAEQASGARQFGANAPHAWTAVPDNSRATATLVRGAGGAAVAVCHRGARRRVVADFGFLRARRAAPFRCTATSHASAQLVEEHTREAEAGVRGPAAASEMWQRRRR